MSDWASEAMTWLAFAEQQVAALLKLIGQDNEVVTLSVVVLVALVTLAIVWALLLAFLRGFLALFGGGRPRETVSFDRPQGGFAAFTPASAGASEAGRLDVVPSAAATQAPRLSPREAFSVKAQEPRVSTPRPSKARPRLSEAAGGATSGALPISPSDDLHQVQLRQMPQLADRGRVVSARPEWTGKVVPSSLQEAGAVEVCRVLSRRAPTLVGNETVRAVDYRVCGLPRVDGEGRRQPDVLVYTVADRGFLPKNAPAKQGRR